MENLFKTHFKTTFIGLHFVGDTLTAYFVMAVNFGVNLKGQEGISVVLTMNMLNYFRSIMPWNDILSFHIPTFTDKDKGK